MRLINTYTLELREFVDARSAPDYAILSHQWGQDEVSFKDYQKGRKKETSGYLKIVRFCAFARSHGHAWVWVDTCCIDKRSSAELSEAINSMFAWYAASDTCYAYLSDVAFPDSGGGAAWADIIQSSMNHSKWFTRGWTLQELIAPKTVVFVDEKWTVIGAKYGSDAAYTLQPGRRGPRWINDTVSEITRIPLPVLRSSYACYGYSVAQRFSWASQRETTRVEDQAYCLLGIFNIAMPLLYGEGLAAFLRLGREILVRTEDESLFAWQWEEGPNLVKAGTGSTWGMLCNSPRYFLRSAHMHKHRMHERPPLVLTNRGLEIRISSATSVRTVLSSASGVTPLDGSVLAYRNDREPHHVLLALNCTTGLEADADGVDSCALELQYSPSCGHYRRYTLHASIERELRPTRSEQVLGVEMPWHQFVQDETLWVHMTSSDDEICVRERRMREYTASLVLPRTWISTANVSTRLQSEGSGG